MIREKVEMCKACATGNEKHSHNGDPNSCIKGRMELIRHLKPVEQIEQLMIHERLPASLGKFILKLSKERKKTPIEIIEEEGLDLL